MFWAKTSSSLGKYRVSLTLIGALSLSLAACYEVIPQYARAEGGAWTMELLTVRVGPNSYPTSSGVVFTSGAGNTLLWFYLRATNSSSQDRRFGWKRCILTHGKDVYVPGLVTPNSDLNQLADDVEIIRAGQSVERRIGIAYPKDLKPSELVCGKAILPFHTK